MYIYMFIAIYLYLPMLLSTVLGKSSLVNYILSKSSKSTNHSSHNNNSRSSSSNSNSSNTVSYQQVGDLSFKAKVGTHTTSNGKLFHISSLPLKTKQSSSTNISIQVDSQVCDGDGITSQGIVDESETQHEQEPISCLSGILIDTPGIREFNLHNPKFIQAGFREIKDISQSCQYKNCQHGANERGCAVLQAVISGEVEKSRYDNFKKLLYDTTNS